MNNGNEQFFKCKIGYNFYFIKISLLKRQINIEITSNSAINKENTNYINNYTLSHFQEINPYFKNFQSIREVYKTILGLLKKKKFFIIQNKDSTLTFILKIKVRDELLKINLALSKCSNQGIYSQNKVFSENYMDTVNNDLLNMKNIKNYLDPNQYLFSYSNNYLPTNKTSEIINNDNSKFSKILSKMTQLENDNNEKNKKIKMLEKQIKMYKNKGITDDDEEEEEENEEKEENEEEIDDKYNDFGDMNNKNFKIDFNKTLTIPFKNKKKKINRNNSYDKINSINSNFEPKSNQINHVNSYYPRNISIDPKFNKVKTTIDRNNKRKDNLHYNLSMDQVQNNFDNVKTYAPNSKAYKYLNSIPETKRENIPNLNSRIIFTKKEYNFIIQQFREIEKTIKVELRLIYRASSDGDFEEAVKLKFNGELKTLTLFHTMEGYRFGFYVQKRIKTTIKSGTKILEVPGTSFLVGLNNFVCYHVYMKKNSLFEKSDNFFCFGYCSNVNNNKTRWLVYTQRNNFINKKFLFGDKNDVYVNLNTSKIIGNSLTYHIKDIELFEVVKKYLDEED